MVMNLPNRNGIVGNHGYKYKPHTANILQIALRGQCSALPLLLS